MLEKFESKFIPEPNSGCWLWTGPFNAQGYGRFTVRRNDKHYSSQSAPRIAWRLYRGEIPIGKWVLHRCDTPECVNPDHLFIGTRQDNIDDMMNKGRQNQQKKTHCPMGHLLGGNNLYLHNGRHRVCRACNREAAATYRDKKKPQRLRRTRRLKYG